MWLLTESIELAEGIKDKTRNVPCKSKLLGFRHFDTGRCFIGTETI